MRTVTYRLVDLIRAIIPIGFRGENETTRVIFDCKKAFEEYPDAIPSLAVTPPVGESYPAICVRDGDLVYWDILDSDVANEGRGEGQLTFTVDSIVRKSYTFRTKIDRSIFPTGEAPEPIDDWITRANTALAEVDTIIEELPETVAEEVSEQVGNLIDDTAGTGDTDKVWSADKVSGELDGKADKTDTVLNTTLSMHRNTNPGVGQNSVAIGNFVSASGNNSMATGYHTGASGRNAFASGDNTTASGDYSFSEGSGTVASGEGSHAEGGMTQASGHYSHSENRGTVASGNNSHSEGFRTTASGIDSHADGCHTVANHMAQHVFGVANVEDPSTAPSTEKGNYIEIVGNGLFDHMDTEMHVTRRNARALDWDGNERLRGDLYVHCNPDSTSGKKVLYEPRGIRIPGWTIKVNNSQELEFTEMPDPTSVIYDNAGQYATNKTWSASKLINKFEDKLDAPSTAGTAGQVLTADGQGGQSWADPQGGGTIIPVFSYDSHEYPPFTCDMTYADILSAIQAGTCTGAIVHDYDTDYSLPVVTCGNGSISFSASESESGNSNYKGFALASDDTIIVRFNAESESQIIAPRYEYLDFPVVKGTICYHTSTPNAPTDTTTSHLYKANQDIATQENWNSDHWDSIMLADELESSVKDVQVNGTSVVSGGVANVPLASTSNYGAVKIGNGLQIKSSAISTLPASVNELKAGAQEYKPVAPSGQHYATFYGLAKAAGENMANSSNAVGNYTDSAKSAISQMLNAPVSVTGTTPSITALAGVRYVCGEVSTLDITLPASGCIDVTFTSGATATVLTITPPTGVTVRWANGFDPTSLDANTTYEINIMDGLGVAVSWT